MLQLDNHLMISSEPRSYKIHRFIFIYSIDASLWSKKHQATILFL